MFEDAVPEFFGVDGVESEEAKGWFLRLLEWDPPALKGDVSLTSYLCLLLRTFTYCTYIFLSALFPPIIISLFFAA